MSEIEFLVNKLLEKREKLEEQLADDEYLTDDLYYQYLGAYTVICDIFNDYWNKFIKEEFKP